MSYSFFIRLLSIQPFADTCASYMAISSSVLEYCLRASHDERLHPEHLYRADHDKDEEYGSRYIFTKLREQEAAFNAASPDFDRGSQQSAVVSWDWAASMERQDIST